MRAPVPLLLLLVAAAPAASAAPPSGAPLLLDVTTSDGKPVAIPMVEATVNGRRTRLVVDTGAETHVLDQGFARALKLPLGAVDTEGFDSSGKALQLQLARGPRVSVAGVGTWRPDFIVTPLPSLFAELGIGGILSPQLLEEGAHALVMDLRTRRLRREPVARALAQLGGLAHVLTPLEVRACFDPTTAVSNLQLSVPAAVDGEAARLTLDTGASATSLGQDTAAARKVATRLQKDGSVGMGAGGTFQVQRAPDTRLQVGSLETTTTVTVQPHGGEERCGTDGLLGMDVLNRCVLVLQRTRFAGACAAAPAPLP